MRAAVLLAAALILAPAASAAPSQSMQASRMKILSVLSPGARAWISAEARREIATDTVSTASATAAANASGVDFGTMSVEDAIVLVMMEVSGDAENDLRQMLSQMQNANRQKQALRNTVAQEKTAQTKLNDAMRQEYGAVHGRIALSYGLNAYLAQHGVSQDSLGDISQEQQRRMQALIDDMTKADRAASDAEKKFTDTANAIIQNMK